MTLTFNPVCACQPRAVNRLTSRGACAAWREMSNPIWPAKRLSRGRGRESWVRLARRRPAAFPVFSDGFHSDVVERNSKLLKYLTKIVFILRKSN